VSDCLTHFPKIQHWLSYRIKHRIEISLRFHFQVFWFANTLSEISYKRLLFKNSVKSTKCCLAKWPNMIVTLWTSSSEIFSWYFGRTAFSFMKQSSVTPIQLVRYIERCKSKNQNKYHVSQVVRCWISYIETTSRIILKFRRKATCTEIKIASIFYWTLCICWLALWPSPVDGFLNLMQTFLLWISDNAFKKPTVVWIQKAMISWISGHTLKVHSKSSIQNHEAWLDNQSDPENNSMIVKKWSQADSHQSIIDPDDLRTEI